jgi:hypothetical protein
VRRPTGRLAAGRLAVERRAAERWTVLGVRRTPVLREPLIFLAGISIYLLDGIFHYQNTGKNYMSIKKIAT